jgi:hypothetical protein
VLGNGTALPLEVARQTAGFKETRDSVEARCLTANMVKIFFSSSTSQLPSESSKTEEVRSESEHCLIFRVSGRSVLQIRVVYIEEVPSYKNL